MRYRVLWIFYIRNFTHYALSVNVRAFKSLNHKYISFILNDLQTYFSNNFKYTIRNDIKRFNLNLQLATYLERPRTTVFPSSSPLTHTHSPVIFLFPGELTNLFLNLRRTNVRKNSSNSSVSNSALILRHLPWYNLPCNQLKHRSRLLEPLLAWLQDFSATRSR